jgi:hypothetical protein
MVTEGLLFPRKKENAKRKRRINKQAKSGKNFGYS